MQSGNLSYSQQMGIEKYIKDSSKKEVYITLNNQEIYAFDFVRKREILAKDSNNNEFYCKRNGNEIYPVFLDTGLHRFVTVNGIQIYAKDKFGNQKYPLNRSRKEKLAKDLYKSPQKYYARDKYNEQFYPKDDLGNEWAYDEKGEYLIAVTNTHKPKAPVLKNGKVKYVKEGNKEILYQFENYPFFGKDISGNEIYPIDENKDQYYPIHNMVPMFAKLASGQEKYALNHLQKIIYPKDFANEEHYIEHFSGINHYSLLEEQAEYFERYAADQYPIKRTANGNTDVLINNKLLDKYPLDSNTNEFTTEAGDVIDSLGYPITNDNFIIIPNVDNKPKIKPGDDHLLKHIKFLLYRPCYNTYDFLTDIKSTRKSNLLVLPYKTLKLEDYKIEISNTEYYIIGGLILLICIFVIFILSK